MVKDLIEYIASSLVDDPTQVQVTQFQRGPTINLRLRVAKEDMGRVIGRGGRVANAMRNLLRVAAAQEGKRAFLDVEDPR
ncbi:MAG: KH domain-containing protein [Chloroflexi bacterium]|nr:KH domain-containing protein [Chloroflexota bacterium]